MIFQILLYDTVYFFHQSEMNSFTCSSISDTQSLLHILRATRTYGQVYVLMQEFADRCR